MEEKLAVIKKYFLASFIKDCSNSSNFGGNKISSDPPGTYKYHETMIHIFLKCYLNHVDFVFATHQTK